MADTTTTGAAAPEKTRVLIVVSPITGYEVGARITDPAAIAKVLANPASARAVVVTRHALAADPKHPRSRLSSGEISTGKSATRR